MTHRPKCARRTNSPRFSACPAVIPRTGAVVFTASDTVSRHARRRHEWLIRVAVSPPVTSVARTRTIRGAIRGPPPTDARMVGILLRRLSQQDGARMSRSLPFDEARCRPPRPHNEAREHLWRRCYRPSGTSSGSVRNHSMRPHAVHVSIAALRLAQSRLKKVIPAVFS
jgi:hypothetical protein